MHSPPLDARAAWNRGANAFIQFVESGADYYRHLVHGPALLEASRPRRGERALDLGCGQGYFSRLLARAGATVTGIDLADSFVERALQIEAEEPLGITYQRLDASQVGAHFSPASFDLVTACMALQDMSDPAVVIAAVRGLLASAGRFVFSVPHPCTDMPVREWQRDARGRKLALCLDRYFESGPAVCDWTMARLKYHWQTPCRRFTLSEWSASLRQAGFVIRGIHEPRPTAEILAAHPELDDCARLPYFLIFDVATLPIAG